MYKKITFIITVIFMLLVGCSSANTDGGSKDSESFPRGNVTLIVPFAPGGGTDTAARTLAQYFEKQLPDTTIVIKNVQGGGGAVGVTELLNAKNDGYTIGIVPQATIAIQPHYGSVEYNYDSFEPILKALTMPQGLFVKKDAPWETAEEWIDYVKENPGVFRYGTSAHGGEQHLAMLDLDNKAEIKNEHIPFASGGESITALTGGHIEGAVAFPKIADPEQLRLLFSLGEERNEDFPDIPTMKELGYDVSLDVYFGIIAPKGVPEEKLNVLHDAFYKALEEPELKEKVKELGFNVTYADSATYQKQLEDTYTNSKEIIDKAGLE